MSEKELIDMVISERIGRLLEQNERSEDGEIPDPEEELLQGLGEEKQAQMEGYINHLVEAEARNERDSYLGGFRDGVCLVLKLCRIGKGEIFGES